MDSFSQAGNTVLFRRWSYEKAIMLDLANSGAPMASLRRSSCHGDGGNFDIASTCSELS